MSDIIHLLPDSIANQIAAGEVVQRPASVVKELVENAIDAGADCIQVLIKDAGRTLVQIIDNGKGMSATDARMAFERHATSKIKKADDLFALRTMGFRGEALPSIAAISQVEIKTKQDIDELGTLLQISGSNVEKQESVSCATGCNIMVRNIFFNVPARRKFLKSNDTERKNIITELERIMLVHPNIEFSFYDNDVEIFRYPASNLKQRIISVVGKSFANQLIAVEADTYMTKISGYVGKPESARKVRPLQYFFVNGRYMRHPYFGKAVSNAFEPLLAQGENSNYFIYMEVDPATIDVNIHPTKTEVKFENEQAIWQILSAVVKESLGKFNEIPSIDFDMTDAVEIPIHDPSKLASAPRISVDPTYNPFKSSSSQTNSYRRPKLDWEQFYEGFEKEKKEEIVAPNDSPANLFETEQTITTIYNESDRDKVEYYQYKNRYIVTSVKSGLMLIDQHRAHIRILFDQFLLQIQEKKGISQRTLFPEIIELSASEASLIPLLMDDFEAVGFDLSNLGNNAFAINGIPSETTNVNVIELVHKMISSCIDSGKDTKNEIHESIALSMAKSAAIPYGHKLTEREMVRIIDQLFASPVHKHTPDGKTIIAVLDDKSIEKLF